MFKLFILSGGLLLSGLPVLATPPTVVAPAPIPAIEFVANRNQWEKPVLFAANVPAGRLFLERGRLLQVRYDAEQADKQHHHALGVHEKQPIRGHAYATTFVGANPQAVVSGETQLAGYSNYFLGNNQSRWASHVPGYGEVRYQALYPGIDLHFYSQEKTLEYDFEVAAGADVKRIVLRYEGQTQLRVEGGALHVETSVGTVVEQRPYAYQLVAGQRQRVACEYALNKDNTMTFSLPKGYNHALPLVIDPVLVYATYSGSTADNYGFTATYDSLGNLYSGGNVFDVGYPTTTGAFDTSHNGGAFSTDMGIIKYNPNAATGATSRVWATYIGGNSEEQPQSMVVDHQNNLIILGSSLSTNYPTTVGAYDRTLSGTDIVITKLNPTGSALVGSTFLGGTGVDGQLTVAALEVNYGDESRGDVTIDRNNNIYLASMTAAATFPTTAGVFQPTKAGTATTYDGVVSKFNPTLTSLIWSSFLGGSGADAAYSIQLDSINNVFVSGGTNSTNFPGTTGGYNSTARGGVDGFIARISPDGSTLVRSTYLGTTAYDQAYLLQLDRQGAVYAFGQTAGAYPVSAGVYSNAGSRQFIHKLNAQLTGSLFSTVIGNGASTSPSMSPTAFLVDNCGQILLSGWTRQAGMPITAGAIQSTGPTSMTNTTVSYQGYFYIGQLAPNAQSLVYGTYYGNGTCHVDGGTSRFDKKGTVYQAMCVGNTGPNLITSANGWSRTNRSSWNNAAFKMDVVQVTANFVPAVTATSTVRQADLCAPATFYFNRPSSAGTSVLWNFGNGQTSTQSNNVQVVYQTPGRYPVRLTVFDNNSCQQGVTSVDTVVVFDVPRPQVNAGSRQTICSGTSATLTATNLATAIPAATYTWTAPGQPTLTGATVTASPTATALYTVTIRSSATTGSCSATDTVTVHVVPRIALNATFVPSLTSSGSVRQDRRCAPATFFFNRPTVAGSNVTWDFGNGQTSTLANNATASYATPGKYAVTLTVLGVNSCSPTVSTMDSVTVYAVPQPQVAAASRQPICIGTSAALVVTNLVTNTPNVTYAWTAAGQPTLTGASVTAQPTVTTRYTVTASTPAAVGGCTATDTVTVRVLNEPLDARFVPALTAASTMRQAGQCAPATFYFNRPAVVGTGVAWDFGNGTTSTQANNATASYATPGKYYVRLTVTNTNGCTASKTTLDSVMVYAVPQPQVTPVSRQLVCAGSATTLSVNNLLASQTNVAYVWTAPGQPTLTGPTVNFVPAATARYTVTATAADGGCAATDTVTVHVLNRLTVSAGPTRSVCAGAATTLSVPDAGPGITYTWTAPGQATLTGRSVTVSPTASVRYRINIANTNGCHGRDSVQLNVAAAPVLSASVSSPNLVNQPVTFTNTSTGATSYVWDFGDGTPVSTETSPTHTYTTTAAAPFQARLTATYGPGCEASTTVAVPVRGFDLPNVITPNGDGLNDTFRPFVSTTPMNVQIFNRWGRMVFEQTNYTDGWDAANDPAGVYYYRILDANGASWKGWVEVIK